jgi:HlyD family secretion protein
MELARLKAGAMPSAPDEDDVVLSPMDRRIERRRFTPQRLAIGAGIALLVVALGYGYVRYGLSRTLTIGTERLTVARVSYDTFHEYIPITGNVVPLTTVYLDAIDGGQVTHVFVEEGAYVEAGESLVRLKNTALQLEVIGREAQLTEQLNFLTSTNLAFEQSRLNRQREMLEIDYQLALTRRHLEIRRPLIGTGGATQQEVDDLEAKLDYYDGLRVAVREAQGVDERFQSTQMKSLQEALDAMNFNLDIARQNLDDLTIIAPITGQLTLLEANVGESKAPGVRIGQIDQINEFKVTALVDEFYLTRVIIGQRGTVDIAGESHELEISKVYPGVQNRQFEIDLEFLGVPPDGIRRGQTLRMRLEIGQPADTLVLENGPFYEDTGGQWVFVLESGADYAERRNVRLGRRNPEGIEVLAGLEEGESVIVSTYANFTNFDRIQFQD